MVEKIKPSTLDEKYVAAVETFYNTADHDLDLMIASSKRVASEQKSKGKKVGQLGRTSQRSVLTQRETSRMTQSEIISDLAKKAGLKKSDVRGIFDALMALASSEVKRNGEFTIPGFGKLVKTTRQKGRNSATAKTAKIPAKTIVKLG
jgi:DNA-binding protein HU-beta